MPPAALNLLVFRDDRRRVSGLQLKSAVIRQIQNLRRASSADHVINALLRAGELECGVSDAALTSVRASAVLTEHLANALINPESALDAGAMQAAIDAAVPGQIAISSPEGFAYYALHPLAFADVVEQLPLRSRSVGVIGIRSIGTTLSAVATAAARARGLRLSSRGWRVAMSASFTLRCRPAGATQSGRGGAVRGRRCVARSNALWRRRVAGFLDQFRATEVSYVESFASAAAQVYRAWGLRGKSFRARGANSRRRLRSCATPPSPRLRFLRLDSGAADVVRQRARVPD